MQGKEAREEGGREGGKGLSQIAVKKAITAYQS